jgi:hypothetical protein
VRVQWSRYKPTHHLEDWRSWVLHVNDELGKELFIVLFSFVFGRPH